MRAYVPSERALLRNRVCQGGMAQGLSWQHAGAAAGPLGEAGQSLQHAAGKWCGSAVLRGGVLRARACSQLLEASSCDDNQVGHQNWCAELGSACAGAIFRTPW